MDASTIIKRLQAQRESWCELQPAADGQPAKAVRLRRPAEAELPQYRAHSGQSMHQLLLGAVSECATDWRGITEADLLGASIGSSDPVSFDPALWAEVVRDRMAWVGLCATHLTEAIAAHLEVQDATAKN